MSRVLASSIGQYVGQSVILQGWVHRLRDLGGVRFLLLRDRSGFAQVVLPSDLDLGAINNESVVQVTGTVRAEPRAHGGHEVAAPHIGLIAIADPPPIDLYKKNVGTELRLETLLDNRAVSLRIPDVLDVFKIQAEMVRAFRAHLNQEGFTEIFTPKIVKAGAEGGSAVFEIAYYDSKAYLGQSPQFYKQMMVGSGLERVFEVGHAYRAEKSETSRHLAEFVSLDFEMGFIESEQDVMQMLTGAIRAMFHALRENRAAELARRKIALLDVESIPQLDFPEAKKILRENFNKTEGVEGDLDTESEKLIGSWAESEFKSPLLFVTGYDISRRPAYAMPRADHPASRSFDLLYRGVEITTGGQRIHDHAQLTASFQSRGLNPDAYTDYFAAFKHGMPPHGGMGLGLERLTKQLLNLENVRQATLFPRDRYRLTP